MKNLLGCQSKDISYASAVKNGKQPVDFDDAFVQELMDRIETLTKEKSDISHQLCQEKSSHEELNRNVNIMNICAYVELPICKILLHFYIHLTRIFHYYLEIITALFMKVDFAFN